MSNRQSLKKGFLPDSQISADAAAAQQKQAVGSAADFGQYARPVEAEGNRPPAKLVLQPVASPATRSAERGKWRCAAVAPGQCVAVRRGTRGRLALAAARRQPELHRLGLTDREFLHIYHAVRDDRDWTRKAISKGLCHEQDLKASESLWVKLESIMVARMVWGVPS